MDDILAVHPLFQSLSEAEQATCLEGGNRRISLPKGRVVHLQNEQCSALDLILEGSVVVQSIDEQGNVLTISELGPGELIGLNLLFSQRNHYPMTITAKSQLVVLRLLRTTVTHLCMHNQRFLLSVLQNLSDRSVFLTDRIRLMAAKSIRQSITEFLIYESHSQGSRRVVLPFSKKELAERFGISRTSLSRELQKMRQQGLVAYDRRTVSLLDPLLVQSMR